MDETLVESLAIAAGLEIAWRDFRDDVIAAAAHASTHARGVGFPTDPAAEPWPPMQARTVR